jgi:ureidoacrylate peracid hydrolase
MEPDLKELLKPANSAILAIDIQNDPCHPEGLYAKLGRDVSLRREAAHNAAAFIDKARKFNLAVIFVKLNHSKWNESPAWIRRSKLRGPWTEAYKEGTWGEQFYAVQPKEEDPIVIKHRYSAFVGTDLEMILRSRNITTLIVTGGGTAACVESTVRHGLCLDYDILVISDCCGSSTVQEHSPALKRMDGLGATVVESGRVLETLEQL